MSGEELDVVLPGPLGMLTNGETAEHQPDTDHCQPATVEMFKACADKGISRCALQQEGYLRFRSQHVYYRLRT